MEDAVTLVVSAAMVVLGTLFVWRAVRARSRARRAGPVRARVVDVKREERRTRTSSWLVTTTYEVPGRGLLVHRRWFEDEGPALLWQRLHREGSEHDVFPHPAGRGEAFVAEDLR
jgi:hypothetical protein